MRSTLRRIREFIDKYINTILAIMTVGTLIIAIASLIIAVNSMKIATDQVEESHKQTAIMIGQFKEMSNYSRQSTRPSMVFLSERRWDQVNEVGIYIKNAGLGPAVIKKTTLVVNGKTYDGSKEKSFNEALAALGLTRSPGFKISFLQLGKITILNLVTLNCI